MTGFNDLSKDNNKVNNVNQAINVEKLVTIAVMAALTFVAAFVLHIPYINGNVLHMGDGFVFIGAIILGPVGGAISAAIGMSLFDVISGYAVWAPFTFVIKAVMAIIVGFLSNGLRSQEVKTSDWVKAIIGMIIAASFMCAGYYVAEGLIYGNWQSPILSLPGNIAQSGLGVVVAILVTGALWKTPFKRDFIK